MAAPRRPRFGIRLQLLGLFGLLLLTGATVLVQGWQPTER